jgi:hypothetical protein
MAGELCILLEGCREGETAAVRLGVGWIQKRKRPVVGLLNRSGLITGQRHTHPARSTPADQKVASRARDHVPLGSGASDPDTVLRLGGDQSAVPVFLLEHQDHAPCRVLSRYRGQAPGAPHRIVADEPESRRSDCHGGGRSQAQYEARRRMARVWPEARCFLGGALLGGWPRSGSAWRRPRRQPPAPPP